MCTLLVVLYLQLINVRNVMTTTGQVLLLLGLLAMVVHVTTGSRFSVKARNVLRHHHGVVFEPVDTFLMVQGNWLHTFEISLPDKPQTTSMAPLNCTQARQMNVNETHCQHVKPFVDALIDIDIMMSRTLMDSLLSIERLIPNRRPDRTHTRHTRSWIPIIGSFLKTSIGTATEADVTKLRKAIDDLRRRNVVAYNKWAKTEDMVASTMRIANSRMNDLRRLVDAQHVTNIEQYQQLSDSLDDLYSFTSIVPTALKRITSFTTSLVHIFQLRSAVEETLHGRLSTLLVSHSQMAAAMHGINVELRKLHPAFQLAHRTLGESYQITDFVIGRVATHIYISIKFPVTTIPYTFTLYQLRVFPVMMPNDEPHTTALHTNVKALGHSREIPYYIEFTSTPKINKHFLDMSSITDTLTYIRTPSCIYALFINAASLVRRYCTFHLHANSLQPAVHVLDASVILFTNVTNITRTCANADTVQLPPCAQCLYRLPCGCSYETELAYIPPNIENCGPLSSNRTQRPNTHITNLAMLSAFFSADELGAIASDTFLRHPVRAHIPNFQLFEHNYSSILAAVDETKFDMSRAVNLSVQRATAYRSMAEYLAHKKPMTDVSDDWFTSFPSSYATPLLLLSVVLSSIAVISTVMLSVKLRTLYVLCMGIKPTTAVQIPTYFDFYKTMTTPITSSTQSQPVTALFGMSEISFAVICVLTFLLIILLAYKLVRGYLRQRRPLPRTEIFLRFPTKTSSIYLHFLTLPDTISCYTFSASDGPTGWKIVGSFAPKLVLDWPNMKIWHTILHKEIPLPEHISISRYHASQIRAFFTHTFPFPKPLFYSYADKTSFPQLIPVIPRVDDMDHTPSAPQDPSRGQCHLYPIV